MIRGIFCHSLPIYKDIDGNYCSTTLTDSLFQRYLEVVDYLVVAVRVYQIGETYQQAHQEKISDKRIEVLEFPNLSNPRIFISKMKSEKRRIMSAVKSCDLIFIRGGVLAQMGVDAARNLHKPYLLECSGCSWDEYWNYSLLGKCIAPYMEFRAKRDAWNADYVVYVTERWLQSRYPTKGISTYASNVILTEMDSNVLVKRKKKIKEKDADKVVVGTIGGIGNKAKGQQYVIRAISRLKEKINIKYELVGGGDKHYLESEIKKFGVEDRVVFKGQMTHDEVMEWIDQLDLYIQPSMQEGLPRALIEAMSRACPAVGSNTGGTPELLDAGYVFKRGNVNDLKLVLLYALRSDLLGAAERNFQKSKEYALDKLNNRRMKIFNEYKDCVIENTGGR